MGESDSAALVREVLDRAIAEVAEAKYRRLSEAMSLEHQIEAVDNALKSLTRLQKGIPPDYSSEWIALFYLSWYQPRQIHLAYAALRGLLAHSPLPRHVIDYGCGALAVQIASAILLAEEQELLDSGLAVHGVDSNMAMMDNGKELWDKFREITGARSHVDSFFKCLHVALDRMSDVCSCHASFADALAHLQAARASASGDFGITAVHAVYPSNMEQLKDVLDAEKCHERGSAIELVTFFESAVNKHFFDKLGFDRDHLRMLAWTGRLDATTRWRERLSEALPGLEKRGLLRTRPVVWDPSQRIARGEDIIMFRSRAQ